jgi:hypothetical protein
MKPELNGRGKLPWGSISWTAAALTFAGILAFTLSPGWLFWDSARQWQWAVALAAHGIPEQLSELGLTTQWPLLPTLMKVPFVSLPAGPALQAFLQLLALIAAIALLGRALGTRGRCWAVVGILLTPFVWNYGLFHSSDTPVAILACCCTALVIRPELTPRAFWMTVALSTLATAFRYNALPMALFFMGVATVRMPGTRWRRWSRGVLAVVGSLLAVFLVVRANRTAHPMDVSVSGALLRVWQINTQVDDPRLDALLAPMVDDPHTPLEKDCFEVGMWCDRMQRQVHWKQVQSAPLLDGYLRSIRAHPTAFLGTQLQYARSFLGVESPLPETEIGRRDTAVPLAGTKMVYDEWRELALRWHLRSQRVLGGLPSRPLPLLLMALLLLWLGRVHWRVGLVLVGLSVSYCVPLILIAPSRDFRYYLPMLLVCYAMTVAMLVDLLIRLAVRARAWRREKAPESVEPGM